MRVKCAICGRNVETSANNYVFANGLHQHKKCPKSAKLSEEDKKDYKELTDAIKWVAVKDDKPLNWKLITSQIKRYKEMGYSYKDQLYTLKYVVERDGVFWGYGRIEKFFEHALNYRKKEEEMKKKLEKLKIETKQNQQTLKVTSKPMFL